jgi:hypothetical protein
MHPELLRALERERRAELLRPYQFRQPRATPPAARRPVGTTRRVRHSVGLAFVSIGTRLMRDGRTSVDLIDGRR